jgi:hypothetical protein
MFNQFFKYLFYILSLVTASALIIKYLQQQMIIGPSTYSKDPSIRAEGIMLTLPKQFFQDRGWTYAEFEKYFKQFMAGESSIWNFRLTNLPKREVAWVYLVFEGFIQFRLNLVMYERNKSKTFKDGPDKKARKFPNANWVILCGPAVTAPFEMPQKGFQGFRYTTFLF